MIRNSLLVLLWIIGSTAMAAPNGAKLFSEHCAICHGNDGKGGVGTPLNNESFLTTVSDDYLIKTIRHGRPGRVMPAFQTLGNSQVRAIASHVRSWSEHSASEEVYLELTGDVDNGRKLYARACAKCHGDNGEGGKGTGVTFSRERDLPIVPPALNNSGFLASASNHMIHQSIMDGRVDTPMKPYRGKLSEQEVADLTLFIRSMEDSTASEGIAAEDEPAVLEAESPYGLEETIENVRNAIIAANFAVIRTDHMEYGLVPEGEENAKQVFIDFCNFKFLFDAMKVDPRLGMFLPCRISIVEHNGKVSIMAVNPLAMSPAFNNRELDSACETMYQIYVDILDEATL